MGDFLGKIAEEILNIFKKNYKKPKLWITLGGVFICVALLFPYIDSNFFYFSRMEKRIDILKEVMELDQEKIKGNEIYREEYHSILNEIEQQRERTVNSIINKVLNTANGVIYNEQSKEIYWLKFFSSTIWLLILDIFIPFMKTFKKRSDKIMAFIVVSLFTILLGWIGTLIPTIIAPKVNYFGWPLLQLIFIIFIAIRSNKNKGKNI